MESSIRIKLMFIKHLEETQLLIYHISLSKIKMYKKTSTYLLYINQTDPLPFVIYI